MEAGMTDGVYYHVLENSSINVFEACVSLMI